MKLTRRQFLGTAVVGAAGAAVAACGGDDGGADAPRAQRNCAMNGTNATIAGNHGHVITVTANDVSAGVEKTYDISGSGGHVHMVTVTAANFATLQSNANGSVMVTSTTADAHQHSVTISCA